MNTILIKKNSSFRFQSILILLAIFLFTNISLGQQKNRFNFRLATKKTNANFFRIVEKKKEEIKSYNLKKISDLKEYKHFNRWKEYWRIRVNSDGSFPDENLAYFNAGILNRNGKINITSKTNLSNRLSQESWVNVGTQDLPNTNGYPNYPQMGRLNTFLRIKHPTDMTQDILFVGAPNGGIWKSTDGGATWNPKLDMVAGIGVTDIKTTPDATFANYATKPIYVSTGDWDGENAKSIGVLKSTDGGETFASTGLSYRLSEDKLTGDLAVIDDNTVFVGTFSGISKTIDGGVNWTLAFDSEFTNSNFGRVAVSGNKIMYTGVFDIAYTSDYTNDANWDFANFSNDQIKHAVTVGEDGNFYVQQSAHKDPTDSTDPPRIVSGGQIRKFNSATKTFSNFGSKPPEYNAQGGYNQALIVKNDMIISGEFNGSHSTDNGSSWYRSLNGYWVDNFSDGTYIHSDHHRLGQLSEDAHKFWSVNDGGLNYITYSSNTDQKPTIAYKSAKTIVTQHYSVAINPNLANSDDYIVGNQDNDAFSKVDGVWYAVALGDGIETAINYNNPNIRYATNQSGILTRSDTGFKGELNGDYDTYNSSTNESTLQTVDFYHYMELDRTNPNIIYINANGGQNGNGTKGLLKVTDSGSSLTSINMDNGNTANKFNTHGSLILSISDNNIIRKIPTDGTTPTSITGAQNLGAGVEIESIDFNASNNNVIYVSTKGYNAGKKVFKSTNGGTSFTNITNDLPDVIINKILLKQGQSTEIIFAATNVGVYYTNNGGIEWSKLGQNLPNVDVKDIEINYAADKLVAATFGRGLWQINVANTTLGVDQATIENSLKLSLYPNPLNSGNLKISFKEGINAVKYEIYNVVGGIVKKGAVNTTNEINVDNLTNNIYLIRLYNNDFSVTKKLVLAK